jgi:hypothetical protein
LGLGKIRLGKKSVGRLDNTHLFNKEGCHGHSKPRTQQQRLMEGLLLYNGQQLSPVKVEIGEATLKVVQPPAPAVSMAVHGALYC